MDFLPPENNAVSSLLAVISDPKRAKARLDDLNKMQEAINSGVAEQRQAEQEARKEREAAERIKAEAESIHKQTQDHLDTLIKDYTAKLENLDKTFNEYRVTRDREVKELDEREKQLREKDTNLSNMETSVTAREKDVARREAEVDTIEKEYKDKMAKLKAIF